MVVLWTVLALVPATGRFLARHPLADLKFFFFIFALIPVQTLFTYNWLVLPEYIKRAYTGWIGQYFEIASNFNPILIFILTPIIAALTLKRKVYNMMIWGTFVMAAPAFLLAIGPHLVDALRLPDPHDDRRGDVVSRASCSTRPRSRPRGAPASTWAWPSSRGS